jgi:mannose-6-phosphate isomerase-like protein (cupin superfamily)
MSNEIRNLEETYLLLGKLGKVFELDGGAKFWGRSEAELDEIGDDWLASEFEFDTDWQNWEMHPNGDEVVYIISGSADFILEGNGATKIIEIRGKGLIVIPKGIWHTAKALAPCRAMHITMGKGTLHRPL